jgi:hypothetical protein
MSITCSEFVFVALVIRQAVRMRHIVICGLKVSSKGKPKFLVQNILKQAISAHVRFLIKRHFATQWNKVIASRNWLNMLCPYKRVLF